MDEPLSVELKISIPRPVPTSIVQFARFWRTTNPQLTTSSRHMYGEPTAFTLFKIWNAIQRVVVLVDTDVLLDWGMGAGKALISKRFLSGRPNIAAIGMEMDSAVYEIAKRNMWRADLTNTRSFHRESSTVTSAEWESFGASIVIQYDGGTSPDIEEYHECIMNALVSSRCVKCIFSTKMNAALFVYYFGPEVRRDWTLYRLPHLSFGGSHFMGNLWVRKAGRPTGVDGPA